jgi:SpoVT / AbrB like domain.
MANLVKIGNSHGIRIPKALIEQAHLDDKELKLKIVKDGLLVSPSKRPREGWKEAIEASLAAHGKEPFDSEWLDASLVSDEELEW